MIPMLSESELNELGHLRSLYVARVQHAGQNLGLYLPAWEILRDIEGMSAETLRESISWMDGNTSDLA
jgi:hypothetical protein